MIITVGLSSDNCIIKTSWSTVTKVVNIEVRTTNFLLFCVLQKTKTNKQNTKIVCMSSVCVLFFSPFFLLAFLHLHIFFSSSTSVSASSLHNSYARSLRFCYHHHHHYSSNYSFTSEHFSSRLTIKQWAAITNANNRLFPLPFPLVSSLFSGVVSWACHVLPSSLLIVFIRWAVVIFV